jgi:hypothetical protein
MTFRRNGFRLVADAGTVQMSDCDLIQSGNLGPKLLKLDLLLWAYAIGRDRPE